MSINKNRTVNLCITAAFTAITSVLSQIAVPMPMGVPITLQTLGIAFCGYFLGPVYSVICIFIYILLGLCGVPVFSGFGGGASVLFGPTGGFIFGFLFFAFCCGISERHFRLAGKFLFGIGGLAICHACGVAQFCLVTGSTAAAAITIVSAPYLPKDIICVFIACTFTERIKKAIRWQA